jgi:hypothetical protein
VESPWRRVADLAIGGLTEIGFAAPRLMLVVSHQGRAVLDCATRARIARDRQETGDWFDASRPAAAGIGPLAGQWVIVTGLAGGSLLATTADGWQATSAADGVKLLGPGGTGLFVREPGDIRAFGFSPSGDTFAVASPPSLVIFSRATATACR